MNLYFIVEGRKTESKVYPAWLKILIPNLTQVQWAKDAKSNNYCIFSGNGYPSLLHNHLQNSIEEVNELKNFKYLILILDVDESTVDERIEEINSFISQNKLKLFNTELVIIPQNRCIETWFLGNVKVFKKNPQNKELNDYIKFYNVSIKDPENMGKLKYFNTHSQFHSEYCQLFLKERNIIYTKKNPNGVIEKNYLENLMLRIDNSNHLNSFKKFIEFCHKVNFELQN